MQADPSPPWPGQRPGADPYLDAFARLVLDRGLAGTRVRDVADAVGVNRVTVYRQVGTVRDMTELLLQREIGRSLPDLAAWAAADDAVSALITLLGEVVTVFRSHPVLTKVVADEPELLGPYLLRDLPEVLGRSAVATIAMFDRAMAEGRIARRDPVALADWIARIVITAILAPPPMPLADFFADGLRPLLEP